MRIRLFGATGMLELRLALAASSEQYLTQCPTADNFLRHPFVALHRFHKSAVRELAIGSVFKVISLPEEIAREVPEYLHNVPINVVRLNVAGDQHVMEVHPIPEQELSELLMLSNIAQQPQIGTEFEKGGIIDIRLRPVWDSVVEEKYERICQYLQNESLCKEVCPGYGRCRHMITAEQAIGELFDPREGYMEL